MNKTGHVLLLALEDALKITQWNMAIHKNCHINTKQILSTFKSKKSFNDIYRIITKYS